MASIHPDASIGAVHLTVSDLNRATNFYTDRIGLKRHWHDGQQAGFGIDGSDLLVLTANPDAERVRGTTGLYHFAILVPDRSDLALALHHLAETDTPMQGFSDHLVSEAIYLADPDGNGIEIYCDRPREKWPVENGTLQMATDPLDLDDLLSSLQGLTREWDGLPTGTTIGHVHLHVDHLHSAEQFYRDLIGFDLMVRYGRSASFLSAGGYHHHLGINIWAGEGAPPQPNDAIGLRYYEIVLPDSKVCEEIVARLDAAGHAVEEQDDGYLTRDPANNALLLMAG